MKLMGKGDLMELVYTERCKSNTDLYRLYARLGWNDVLKLETHQLMQAMEQSWYVIYVYSDEKLVGTGRVISDGIINAYICGIGVDPEYQGKGIGKEIARKLINRCKNQGLHVQLLCEEGLVSYYEQMGFEVFATGMKLEDEE